MASEPDYTDAPTLGTCSFCDEPLHRQIFADAYGVRGLVNEDESRDCPKGLFGRHELRRK